MATWRRITGVAGLAAGAVAAGAGAVVAAERIAIGRTQVLRSTAAPEQLGQLRGQPLTVLTDDGVPLHVEIDEPPAAANQAGQGAPPQPVTIIFCHGYTLNQDCWHFQRAALAQHRLVFWDQRDHGRSGRSATGAASIERLGADLDLVIRAAAPGDMPVVLVGHSMGGMTIMTLAGQHPGLFGTKVTGVGLIATAASGLSAGSPWMPGPIRPVLTRALPLVLRGAATGYRAMLVERGRRVAGDLSFLSTRFVGFGDPRVHPAVVDFLEQMIRSTPIEVVAAFGEVLYGVDMRDTLATLGRVPVVTVTGDKDRLISPSLGLELAEGIPGAELVWVPGAGHAVILEAPGVVNEAITGLIARVDAGAAARECSA
ncbi:MAG: alpha/beta fold hydrolase [Streptosporangiaceae bacterium]